MPGVHSLTLAHGAEATHYAHPMTEAHVVTLHGATIMVCSPDGLPLDSERAATELIGEAVGQQAGIVVIPTERLTSEFFELTTGLADELTQKFTTYQLRLVIVGDLDGTDSFRAWAVTANQGDALWFAPTFEDFAGRFADA